MNGTIPDYVNIEPEDLGKGHSVAVTVLTDMASIANHMARTMADCVRLARDASREATLIIPVGPVDQFPVLAELVNQERLSLKQTTFINMDEYLADDGQWVDIDHPLSFRGFMNRKFYDLLDPDLAPPAENRLFPDPRDPSAIGQAINDRGGVHACFGGIGINGHMAFNEPPEPGETVSDDEFANLPTRVLSLSRETRTINSVTVGGELSAIPRQCITVGMREILASRAVRFYCNRSWQSGVVRRVLHGPVTAACPASFLRTHPDASLTICDYVAAKPDIHLR